MELLARLENIEFHLKKLKGENKTLGIEMEALRNENAKLKSAIIEKQQLIINLEENNKISKLAEDLNTNPSSSMLKTEIDFLLKEIDHCLSLVKQ